MNKKVKICNKCKKDVDNVFYVGDSFDINFYLSNFSRNEGNPGSYPGNKFKASFCRDCAIEAVKLLNKNGFNVKIILPQSQKFMRKYYK